MLAEEDFDILCGHVKKETVYAQRYHWQGVADSNVVIEIDALWNVGDKYPEHWPEPLDGWMVSIEGSPSMQAVNSIKSVCAAPSGIVATHELLPAIPYKPFR